MPDDADYAGMQAEAEEQMRQLQRERRAIPRPTVATDCDHCGAELPQLRRDMGEILCTECKTAVEKRRKHFRKD